MLPPEVHPYMVGYSLGFNRLKHEDVLLLSNTLTPNSNSFQNNQNRTSSQKAVFHRHLHVNKSGNPRYQLETPRNQSTKRDKIYQFYGLTQGSYVAILPWRPGITFIGAPQQITSKAIKMASKTMQTAMRDSSQS